MPRWAWLLALSAVILTAFFVPRAQAQSRPLCFMAESADVIHPPEYRIGYGISDGMLVMISVSPNKNFIITFSPPDQPVLCVLVAGDGFEFIEKREARYE